MGNILVTGGNGFVGSHLVEKLTEGYSGIIFDVNDEGKQMPRFSYIRGDLTNYADLEKIREDLEGIVHLGAISRVRAGVDNPLKCMNVNVMGTMNILELARNIPTCPWIILGSSTEANENIYGLSKHIAELCAERYAQDHDLKILALRFASIYGSAKDNKDKLIPRLISKALSEQEIAIDNSKKSFDFIYIDDLVSGICLGIKHMQKLNQKGFFDTISLCSGKGIPLKKLSEIIVKEADSSSIIIVETEKNEDALILKPDKAKKILNFSAQTEIEEGIKKTIQDIKKMNSKS